MDGAHQHAFWKQRVYKEERDRYLLFTRLQDEGVIPRSSMPIASPSSFKPNHSNPAVFDRSKLPPLRTGDLHKVGSQTSPVLTNASPSKIPTSNSRPSTQPTTSGGSQRMSSSAPKMNESSSNAHHVSYRPRGPPASRNGVHQGYHTFTYQGRSFLENTSF